MKLLNSLNSSAGDVWRTLRSYLDVRAHDAHPYSAARARLVIVNLLVVGGILALMAIAVYAWEVHATDQQVNDQLVERTAHALVEGGTVDAALAATPATSRPLHDGGDSAAEQYEPSSPDVFTVVVNRQGVVMLDPANVRSLGLPDAAALQPVLSGRQDSTLITLGDDQHSYRLYSVPIRHNGQIVGALQAGMSLAARYRQLHDLLIILAGVGGSVLMVTAAASFYLAGRALQPMHEAYERQRRFAAAASHELRTPLAIVRSEAELVARNIQRLAGSATVSPRFDSASGSSRPVEPVRAALLETRAAAELASSLEEDMREIVIEVDYMARLVDDLLLLARDATAPSQFLQRDVNLDAVAAEALAKLAPIAEAHGLAVQLDRTAVETGQNAASCVVLGDRDRLKQLVLILVDNAIRYTSEGGVIEVSVQRVRDRHLVSRHGALALLTVKDSGIGIAPQDLPHIFEPFYRAKSVRTGNMARPAGAEATEGAGLGLAVAQWIVRAHGGTIAATSEPGQGAIFTVALPLA